MFKNFLNIIACPDCKGELGEIAFDNNSLGFCCDICKLIFPIKEDIPILLPEKARNYDLEYNLIMDIKKKILKLPDYKLQDHFTNTLKLLESLKNLKTWEWEDEEFWSEAYKQESRAEVEKNWNDRIWQREYLVDHLKTKTGLERKTILEVGCGEGQNFRLLLSKSCNETSLYIATDISFKGLKLNRKRNSHKNSLYLLCSADELPIHKKTIDILCYFGILHHTERKTGTIPQDSELVKTGGFILVHEALEERRALLPSTMVTKTEESVHEERISKKKLLAQINNLPNFKITVSREMTSIFFSAMMNFFSGLMLSNKPFFKLISNFDIFLVRLIGNNISFFRAGEIMLVIQKR